MRLVVDPEYCRGKSSPCGAVLPGDGLQGTGGVENRLAELPAERGLPLPGDGAGGWVESGRR